MSKQSCSTRSSATTCENHQVHIHYYKPRGDQKEAWDNIDIVGFAGMPMQMKVNFLCQDSGLAAPLVVDLVRLLDVAKRAGERASSASSRCSSSRPTTRRARRPSTTSSSRSSCSSTGREEHAPSRTATATRCQERQARDAARREAPERRGDSRSSAARRSCRPALHRRWPIVGDDERRAVMRVLDRGVLSGVRARESVASSTISRVSSAPSTPPDSLGHERAAPRARRRGHRGGRRGHRPRLQLRRDAAVGPPHGRHPDLRRRRSRPRADRPGGRHGGADASDARDHARARARVPRRHRPPSTPRRQARPGRSSKTPRRLTGRHATARPSAPSARAGAFSLQSSKNLRPVRAASS